MPWRAERHDFINSGDMILPQDVGYGTSASGQWLSVFKQNSQSKNVKGYAVISIS